MDTALQTAIDTHANSISPAPPDPWTDEGRAHLLKNASEIWTRSDPRDTSSTSVPWRLPETLSGKAPERPVAKPDTPHGSGHLIATKRTRGEQFVNHATAEEGEVPELRLQNTTGLSQVNHECY